MADVVFSETIEVVAETIREVIGTTLVGVPPIVITVDEVANTVTISGGGADSAAQILTKLLTVDGVGSGLDADFLDGQSSAAFATAAHNHSGVYQPLATVLTNTTASFTTAKDTKLTGIATGAEVNDTAAQILTKLLTVDGPGSNLDADTLDGTSSAGFATAGHMGAVADSTPSDDTSSGITATFTAGTGGVVLGDVCYVSATGTLIKADADALATSAVVALATGTLASSASGSFLLFGVVRDDSAYNFTPGGLIYLSTTAGGITQTQPSGADDVVAVLGVALTADKWLFNPQLVLVEHT